MSRSSDTSGATEHKREEGAALVEMAFILPVLLLLIFGALESGWSSKNG